MQTPLSKDTAPFRSLIASNYRGGSSFPLLFWMGGWLASCCLKDPHPASPQRNATITVVRTPHLQRIAGVFASHCMVWIAFERNNTHVSRCCLVALLPYRLVASSFPKPAHWQPCISRAAFSGLRAHCCLILRASFCASRSSENLFDMVKLFLLTT